MKIFKLLLAALLLSSTLLAQSDKSERLIAHSQRTPYGSFIFLTDSVEYKYPNIYVWGDPINNKIQLSNPWSIGYNEEIILENFGEHGWKAIERNLLNTDSSKLKANTLELKVNFADNKWDTLSDKTKYYSDYILPKITYTGQETATGFDTLGKIVRDYDKDGLLSRQRNYVLDTIMNSLVKTTDDIYDKGRPLHTIVELNSQNYISQVHNWTYNDEKNGVFYETYLYNRDSSINWLNGSYKEHDSLGKLIYNATLKRSLSAMQYDTTSVLNRRYDRIYDQHGNKIEETIQSKDNFNIWIPIHREESKYNSKNQIIEHRIIEYNLVTKIWLRTYKFEYEYYENGILKQTLSYHNDDKDTVYDLHSKVIMTYTNLGNISQITHFIYDTSKSEFVFSSSDHYYYETFFSDKVHFDSKNDISSTVYPNPFRENVMFVFEADSKLNASITILDMKGGVIERIYFETKKGNNNIAWSNSSIPSGMYFAKINLGKKTKSIKIIKQ